jgi:glutathione S-transferase
MFAALNTVEPPIEFLNVLDMLQVGDESAKSLRSAVVGEVKKRLASLCCCLAGRDYLGDRFTAADLLMVTVLRILRRTGLVEERPELNSYRLRCEARPAFQKALADQMARFAENVPPTNK